ncbi:class I SAM-dependent methyltransferase [Sulfuriferula sp. AH1]|uniref:class I SAM-dependent methyltransferase n=1 Tax=Sulfuriferula sp. AH1 TaxID=1985873 RepID=UPI0012FBBB26|nr:class I SAM-dependent methyltransferase [Sulfuriferula sp. AH1]
MTTIYPRHRPCPVCDSDNATHLYTNTMTPIGGLDMSYQVVNCADCGFIYASELPESASYEAYYRELSKYDVMTSTAKIRPVDQVRMAAAVNLCVPHLTADALIIDIGCGHGALLNAFHTAGWACLYGIDPAPEASAKANALFGLQNVQTGIVRQAPQLLPLDQAALICLTGVLEHLPDLRTDLAALIKDLNHRAMIMVEVPASERFTRTPLEPYGEFSLEHIQYFSTQSLDRLMAELGYVRKAGEIVALSEGVTDSLFGLFVRQEPATADMPYNPVGLQDYLTLSGQLMGQVIDTIIQCNARQLVIYGAGSHSARLLPKMAAACIAERIVGIVDGNPNLLGKMIGRHQVCSSADLGQWPDATIVVSSFGAQDAIAEFIGRQFPNPILRLYP